MLSRDDILRMALGAGISVATSDNWIPIIGPATIERFFKLAYEAGAAAERNRMIADGWRQCAQGQRTTQFCAVADRLARHGINPCPDCHGVGYDASGQLCWCQQNPSF
jgi:hypothetical protein